MDGPDGDGNLGNDFTALTVATSDAVVALVRMALPSTGTATTLTYLADVASTDDDEAHEVAGTYNGAMGTYRCNGTTDCTVTADAMGEITEITGEWIFTPDAGAMSLVADADYLHYGFWLKRTTDSDGAVTYNEIETFAESSVQASGRVTSVTGSADYQGGAVGVYAIRHGYDPTDGELDDATSGHFSARVVLRATFGQTAENDIPPNQLNSLTGTIDQFVLQHGEENDWSVDLQGSIAADTGTASGTASDDADDSKAPAGSYSATFHGDVTAAADGTVPHPGAVVGEFNANFEQGRVAGAFGATKPAE